MKIGFVGLGKLGLTSALAIESKGHEVFGVDVDPRVTKILEQRQMPYQEEEQAHEALEKTNISLVDYSTLVVKCEIIFIAVQTPHDPRFEGITPIPEDRSDFDYSYLLSAIETLATETVRAGRKREVVIISTVLPGTIEKHVRKMITKCAAESFFRLSYNPFFIAMGSAFTDFLNPEFVLLGTDNNDSSVLLEKFYRTIHDRACFVTTIETAELIKVSYNTFIGLKITFGNMLMELCHKQKNICCDDVISALSLATDRIISPKYLQGGMGDGGGCHPRDNIAMSWLAQNFKLSHDIFADIMSAREHQTAWLCSLVKEQVKIRPLSIMLLGLAFKQNSNLVTGSPAQLMSCLMLQEGIKHEICDPYIEGLNDFPLEPRLFFVSTKHDLWRSVEFPSDSVVIDPFRYLHDNPSIKFCTYIPIGMGVEASRRNGVRQEISSAVTI